MPLIYLHAQAAHRHFDERAEKIPVGKKLPGTIEHAASMRRRKNTELAVSRPPFLEPLGDKREQFYEQRLFLGLPWYCVAWPAQLSDGAEGKRTVWRVVAALP